VNGFRFYFTPLTGVLFAFRSRYYCTIGRSGVLSLGGWSPRIHTRFLVSGDTWEHCGRYISFQLLGYHQLRLAFPCHSPRNVLCNSLGSCGEPGRSHDTSAATAATLTLHWFRLIPVRSPLLGKSSFLSFPAGTEMFQFSAFPPLARFREMNLGRLPDLGDLRIKASSAAPRSLSQLRYVLHRL
jgi:hypothetical protein